MKLYLYGLCPILSNINSKILLFVPLFQRFYMQSKLLTNYWFIIFTLYVMFFPIINRLTMYCVQHTFSIQHHSKEINESNYCLHVPYFFKPNFSGMGTSIWYIERVNVKTYLWWKCILIYWVAIHLSILINNWFNLIHL